MRTHRPTVTDIIISQAAINGLDSTALMWKTGIPRATFYRKTKTNRWTVQDLQSIDRYVHFTPEQCKEILAWRA